MKNGQGVHFSEPCFSELRYSSHRFWLKETLYKRIEKGYILLKEGLTNF